MSGDWLKVEICTPDKPEVIGIADILGITPAHAFGSLFLIWRWFDQHTTAGNASYVTKVTIDRLSGVTGFADAMVKVEWLEVSATGSVILPHFDRHNGETAKQRGLTAKRVAKSKAKSNDKGNASTVTNSVTYALPREEKRREDKIIKELKSNTIAPKKLLAALGIDEKIAEDWITLRKTKKAAITETALKGIQREAEKAGLSLENALRVCCERGWIGFKSEWMLKKSSENFDDKNYGQEITKL